MAFTLTPPSPFLYYNFVTNIASGKEEKGVELNLGSFYMCSKNPRQLAEFSLGQEGI